MENELDYSHFYRMCVISYLAEAINAHEAMTATLFEVNGSKLIANSRASCSERAHDAKRNARA